MIDGYMEKIRVGFSHHKRNIIWVSGIVGTLAIVWALVFVLTRSEDSPVNPSDPPPTFAAQHQDCGEEPSQAIPSPGTQVSLGNFSVNAGRVVSVPVTLNRAPDGLAGYVIEINLDPPGVALIDSIEFPSLGLTRIVANDGGKARFAGVDLSRMYQPGSTDLVLATALLKGIGEGSAEIAVNVLRMDDDSGNLITPTVVAGTIAVCSN